MRRVASRKDCSLLQSSHDLPISLTHTPLNSISVLVVCGPLHRTKSSRLPSAPSEQIIVKQEEVAMILTFLSGRSRRGSAARVLCHHGPTAQAREGQGREPETPAPDQTRESPAIHSLCLPSAALGCCFGQVEVDLVSHDGGKAAGDHCYTFTVIDRCSRWTTIVPVPSRAQVYVFEALTTVLHDLPFAVQLLHQLGVSTFFQCSKHFHLSGTAPPHNQSGHFPRNRDLAYPSLLVMPRIHIDPPMLACSS